MAARVQSKVFSDAVSGTTQSLTFDGATAGGRCVVVLVASYRDTGSNVAWTVTDNKGNTYTEHAHEPAASDPGNFFVGIFSAKNISGGASHQVTVTADNGNSFWHMAIVEYSGLDTTTPFEDAASFTGVNTSANTGNVVSTGGVIAGVIYYEAAGTVTEPGSFSVIGEDETAQYSFVDRVVTANTYDPTWTLGTSGTYHAAAAAFVDGVGGGASSVPVKMFYYSQQ